MGINWGRVLGLTTIIAVAAICVMAYAVLFYSLLIIFNRI